MHRTARLAAGALCSLAFACGDDPRPPEQVPTAAEVRDYYGLNAGSCWRYRTSAAGATVTIIGPDTQRISGRTVYIMSYQRTNGGLPIEWLLDADSEPGTILLWRIDEGRGTEGVFTFENPAPVFAKFAYEDGAVDFAQTTFETVSTPRGAMEAQTHRWLVLNRSAMAAKIGANNMLETVPAVRLSYERTGKPIATYSLVPGYGFADFTDTENVSHQVCASRVCDSKNNCVGANSCAELVCP